MRSISIDIDNIHIDYLYIRQEYIKMHKKFDNLVPYNANRDNFVGKTKCQSLEKINDELNLYKKFRSKKSYKSLES